MVETQQSRSSTPGSIYTAPKSNPTNRPVQKNAINVGQNERLISVGAGGLLTYLGFKQGTLGGVLLMAGGIFLGYRGLTGYCAVYQKLGVTTAEKQLTSGKVLPNGNILVEKSLTIDEEPRKLYTYWRNFENLPRFMQHLEAVIVSDNRHSRWTAKGPIGTKVSWEAEIIKEIPDQSISWKTVGQTSVPNEGTVTFTPAPADRGTEVKVTMQYQPPIGGLLGSSLAKLLGEEPEIQVQEDLRHFKQLMETGIVITTEGQTSGRAKLNLKK